MWNLFGVKVFQRSIVIVVRGRCILSICEFYYMWNLFSVMVFHRSYCQFGFGLGDVFSVYVYSAIRETYLVLTVVHTPFVNWSVEGRCILSICAFCYRWNVFGVMVLHRHIVNWSVGGRCILSICAFSNMWKLFGVMVFHRSIVHWSDR